jgi:hypothetical protein
VAGGCTSFCLPHHSTEEATHLYESRLRQYCFRPADLSRFHLGSHTGWTNRTFIAETVAPRLFQHESFR